MRRGRLPPSLPDRPLRALRVDDPPCKEDRAGILLDDEEDERVVRPEDGRGILPGALFMFMTTPVAAAASVPSSFTSTNAL